MHFWSGVSALAGAMQRHAWIDMKLFKWYPNHYIILTAPPGIVSKSTTVDIAMELLQQVPGIRFGPNAVTGPALIDEFAKAKEMFEIEGIWIEQSALTIKSSEMGNLLDPSDRVLVDWLVDLWDAKTGTVTKTTRGTGAVEFSNPFLNIIACTTPTWLEGNMPEHMIGGGFTSRCLFIYADEKEKLVAYPFLVVPEDWDCVRVKLIHDLQWIYEKVRGPFSFTREAIDYGIAWYAQHNANPPEHLKDKRFRYYLARKQPHLHKLAMILCASRSDERIIVKDDLLLAKMMLEEMEADLPQVFSAVGRTAGSMHMQRFVEFIQSRPEGVPYREAYLFVHTHFPSFKDFEDHYIGAIKAGLIEQKQGPSGIIVRALKPAANGQHSPSKQQEILNANPLTPSSDSGLSTPAARNDFLDRVITTESGGDADPHDGGGA